MKILKAGCILVDLSTKKIGLVYRQKQNDYSFCKGHLDKGETLEECAIRETEEETGIICSIVSNIDLPILEYVDSKGDDIETTYFIAHIKGKSLNDFDKDLVHKIDWIDIDSVEEKLTYQNLKDYWNKIKVTVTNNLV